MSGKRSKVIRKLVLNKDPNMLNTIKRERGETSFSRMTGIMIYNWAKRYYKKYNKTERWGEYGTSN